MPRAIPIKYPPTRLAHSVPNGTVGKTGLSAAPNHHRNQAPSAAPPPTARIAYRPIRLLLGFVAVRYERRGILDTVGIISPRAVKEEAISWNSKYNQLHGLCNLIFFIDEHRGIELKL